ncbi:hypothetical protein ACFYNX_26995 [Streptomyces sp. NPDC007872]|uniref:hypothetical protein n=1 Tax=Streptomyces sp. NPDC007872 TaxID=3364782 RepID=UPI0036CDCF32
MRTGADRAAAAALIDDRARWLTKHGVTLPSRHVAAYQDTRLEAIGLYKDDVPGQEPLIGCLLLNRRPIPHTGLAISEVPSMGISHLYTAPGRDDRIGRLITLWISDFAARTGKARVHAETPSRYWGSRDTAGRLLNHLSSLGWLITGTGINQDRERVTRLQLDARDREGLAALIHCTISRHPG